MIGVCNRAQRCWSQADARRLLLPACSNSWAPARVYTVCLSRRPSFHFIEKCHYPSECACTHTHRVYSTPARAGAARAAPARGPRAPRRACVQCGCCVAAHSRLHTDHCGSAAARGLSSLSPRGPGGDSDDGFSRCALCFFSYVCVARFKLVTYHEMHPLTTQPGRVRTSRGPEYRAACRVDCSGGPAVGKALPSPSRRACPAVRRVASPAGICAYT